ncbi:hypothetical protein Y032_0369g80 [Ancylostoma ceylanicum]|uniref:Uncharacterized protein n=1 Tax=Ancylostoma ceylanicum TaxID=53326 RepID=A0A016RUJ3_9BILA|nr:hypothetical protein Y032_0369g80 [Ancylostoma ceylanicum]
MIKVSRRIYIFRAGAEDFVSYERFAKRHLVPLTSGEQQGSTHEFLKQFTSNSKPISGATFPPIAAVALSLAVIELMIATKKGGKDDHGRT